MGCEGRDRWWIRREGEIERAGRGNKYAFYIFSPAWLARLCMYAHAQLWLASLVGDFHLDSLLLCDTLSYSSSSPASSLHTRIHTHTKMQPSLRTVSPHFGSVIFTFWSLSFFFRASSRLKYKSHNQMGLLPRCCSRRVTYSWREIKWKAHLHV